MPTIINGTSDAITFPDSTIQNTSAIVSGKVPKAALPTGSVLQVVNASYGTTTSNSTSTYVDTGLSASITPTSSTSTVLVIATINGIEKSPANVNNSIALRLVRGSTTISTFMRYANWTNSTTALVTPSGAINYLDNPATTSSTTYKIQFANENNGALVSINSSSSVSFITLMEIAA